MSQELFVFMTRECRLDCSRTIFGGDSQVLATCGDDSMFYVGDVPDDLELGELSQFSLLLFVARVVKSCNS